jgi:hypothetical protein
MSTGQILGGGGGAIIGAILAAPTGGLSIGAGALLGGQLGLVAGGLLDPPKGPTIQGPRLNDLTVQTSTYGQFIPRTYGTIGLSGNVFWLENNALKEVVKKKKSGGKGGGSSSNIKTYTYFATFAIGLCEGPIAGVRRIWVGPDLIYDAGSDDLGTIIASGNSSSKFSIYLGSDTQQPDPRIQAEMGAANCPAYRGLAYIVMKDLALEKYGNSVAGAQVRVEVVNSVSLYPSIIYNEIDTNIESSHGFCISSSEYEIARTYPLSGSSYPAYIRTHLPSKIIQIKNEAVYPGGNVLAGPKIAVGVDYAFLLQGGTIHTSAGIFSGMGFEIINSGFYLFAYSDSLLLLYSGGTGSGTLKLKTKEGFFTDGTRLYLACTVSGEFIYAVTASHIVVFSAVDLSEVSSVGFSSAYTLQVGSVYISYYENKLWVLPSNNSTLQAFDVSSGASLVSFSDSAFTPQSSGTNGQPGLIRDGVIYRESGESVAAKVQAILISQLISQSVPLSSIVSTEAARSNIIKPADIDTTGLTDSVTGFKVTATGSIRNAIEPLRGAWPFDVVQSGYQIKATSRGSASVATIPVGELAIDTQLTESREMDSQLPQNVTVKYIDQGRDYDVNEQRAQRDNTEAVNSLNIDLPVVLSASEAAQVADKLIRIYALEKSDFSFTLPPPYRYLEPGDVITIATDDADFVLRLVSVNHTADGRLECAGRPSSASTYVSIVPGAPGQGGSVTIPLTGATVSTLIDCPVIDEGLQDSPGFACSFNGYSSGWPGGILYQSADDGQTWTDLQAILEQCTSGTATNLLSVSAGNLVQLGGSLTVSLISGELESVTEAQMFNGANFAAYGQPGRWEIIRFQNATLVSAGVYTLDTFWRGDRGTEWATGLHAAGDKFILMTDPDLAFVGIPTDTIGQPRAYRSITAGADIDSAADQAFTYAGVNLETYSGVHPVGRRSASDLTITWKRRTRVGGAWRDNVDASLGETVEAYEVDIMQGAVVKRTLAASAPSVLYTSAMQVTDFGSNQSSVAVNIYQLSSVVGRGYPLGATL